METNVEIYQQEFPLRRSLLPWINIYIYICIYTPIFNTYTCTRLSPARIFREINQRRRFVKQKKNARKKREKKNKKVHYTKKLGNDTIEEVSCGERCPEFRTRRCGKKLGQKSAHAKIRTRGWSKGWWYTRAFEERTFNADGLGGIVDVARW